MLLFSVQFPKYFSFVMKWNGKFILNQFRLLRNGQLCVIKFYFYVSAHFLEFSFGFFFFFFPSEDARLKAEQEEKDRLERERLEREERERIEAAVSFKTAIFLPSRCDRSEILLTDLDCWYCWYCTCLTLQILQ